VREHVAWHLHGAPVKINVIIQPAMLHCRKLLILVLSFRPCEARPYILLVCFLLMCFWHRKLWIEIGRMDVRRFCATTRRPGWTLEKSIKIPQTFPPFFMGVGKKSQVLTQILYHFYLEHHHFQLEAFFRILKNLSRNDGGHTSWCQAGGGGSPQSLRSVGA